MSGAAQLEIQPLTTERFADLAELFSEGGDPKWCWCQYFRKQGLDWSNSTTAGNRSSLESLAARPDLAPGLIGYRDGRVVGWVSLAPREDYGRLVNAKVLARVDDKPVWSIVCFVVSKKERGQGVAAAMLQGAIAYARERGATMLEAYPVAATRGRISPANAFHGVQSMYEKAGFSVVATRRWNKSSPERPIMRLELGQQSLRHYPQMATEISCPQCGAVVPDIDGPIHAYVPSAPGCWAAFGALRADAMLRFPGSEASNLVVDTYMAQHPGNGSDRRDRQSVFVHLVSLCAVVERKASPSRSPEVLRAVLARQMEFPTIWRARGPGDLTVLSATDATSVEDHDTRVRRWANSVWESWREYHPTIRAALDANETL